MTEITKDGYAVFILNDELIAVFSEKHNAEVYVRNTYKENDYRKPEIVRVFFGVEAF